MATTTANTAPTFTVRDGTLMAGFGTSWDDGLSFAGVQKDGKLLVGGSSYDGATGINYLTMARYRADGTLDTTFSADGKVTTALGMRTAVTNIVTQADGKLLVTALADMGYATLRYLADGTLDTTYGTGGMITSAQPFTSNQSGSDLVVGADGKVIVSTYTYGNGSPRGLVRYNTDGTLDRSFDRDGILTLDLGTSGAVREMVVQKDGKILLNTESASVGVPSTNALLRLKADGSLDTTFSGDGKLPTVLDGKNMTLESSLTLQADGKILTGAFIYRDGGYDHFLIRYNANGTLDTTFNGKGFVLSNEGGVDAIAIQPDGKILTVGAEFKDMQRHVVVTRHLAGGALDTTFGDKGTATLLVPRENQGYVTTNDILVQPDGKILVIGSQENGSANFDYVLARFDKNGNPDQTFSPPANTLDATVAYTEGYLPVVLDRDVQVFDAELAAAKSYAGAGLTLKRHGGANADDAFSAKEGGTLSALSAGSYLSVDGVTIGQVEANAGGTLTIGFTANATQALVNKALQQIAYANTSDAPPATVQIDWLFDDGNTGAQGTGGALKVAGSSTVQIAGVNDAPYMGQQLPDLKAFAGVPFSYDIPSNAFVDPDRDTLAYTVLMNDGSGLPPWIAFNPATRTLSGTPGGADAATLVIRVDAKDPSGAVATNVFTLNVGTAENLVKGTAGADNLVGSSGNDVLQGYAGNDTLDGKAGADTLLGGDGNDLYYVDNAADAVSETSGAAGGTDTVYSTLQDYALAGNVENARVLSAGAGNLTGNELGNVLYAGKGNNVLDGGLGNDTASYVYATAAVTVTLATSEAQDTEGSGIDTLRNIEHLTGSKFDDNLAGNQGDNTLNGGAGADLMLGGNGSDTYYVDSTGDIVRETNAAPATGGSDTVVASIHYVLGANLENLTLAGTAAINGTGNALANKLTGNGAANILNGGDGADTLSGGLGNDVLIGGNGKDVLQGGGGNDVFDFNSLAETGITSAGWDVIGDFVRGQDKIDLSTLDANTAKSGNDAFTGFIAATAAFTAAGQLKFVGGVLYGNTDADSAAEFAIQLTGITTLATSDIVL